MKFFNLWIGGSGRDLLQAARAIGIDDKLLRGFYIDPQKPNVALPSDVVHLAPRPDEAANLGYLLSSSALTPLVLNAPETEIDLGQGFHANPKVGSLAMGTGRNAPPIHKLIEVVRGRIEAEQATRVRILGSVFGGSSTTLTPILTGRLRSDPTLHIQVIEVYALLPWFGGADQSAVERLSNARATLLKLDEVRRGQDTCTVRIIPFERRDFAQVDPPGDKADRDPWLRWVAESIFETKGLLRARGEEVVGNPPPQAFANSFVASLPGSKPAPINIPKSPDVAAAAKVVSTWALERAGARFGFLAQAQLPNLIRDLVHVIEAGLGDQSSDVLERIGRRLGTMGHADGGAGGRARDDEKVWRCLDEVRLRDSAIPVLTRKLHESKERAGSLDECTELLAAEVLVALEQWLGSALGARAGGSANRSAGQADPVYEFVPEEDVDAQIVKLTSFSGTQLFRSKSIADPLGAGRLLHARLSEKNAALDTPDMIALRQLWEAIVLGLARFDPEPVVDPVGACRAALGYDSFTIHKIVFRHAGDDVAIGLTHPMVGVVPAYPILDGTKLDSAPQAWLVLRDAWQALVVSVSAERGRLTPAFVKLLRSRLPPVLQKLFPEVGLGASTPESAPFEGRILSADAQGTQRLPLALTAAETAFLNDLKSAGDQRVHEGGAVLAFDHHALLTLGPQDPLLGGSAPAAGAAKVPWGIDATALDEISSTTLMKRNSTAARWL